MEQDFQRALITVVVAGTLIFSAAAVTLYVVFRRFGGAKAGGRAHITLIAGLVAFLLAACAVLFALSYSEW